MNLDKIKKLNKDLVQKSTITDKLNHWKSDYLDEYPTLQKLHAFFETKSADKLGTNNDDGFYSELNLPMSGTTNEALVPNLDIRHLKLNNNEKIEYYYWMLYFLAEKRFEEIVKPSIEAQINTPLGREKLLGKFNNIKKIQNNAKKLLNDGTIEFYNTTNITEEKLYLWYADDYYSKKEFPVQNMKQIHVINVCTHHYVFPYLKKLLEREKKALKENKPELLRLVGIDIHKLVSELVRRGYILEKDSLSLQNWFKGIKPSNPINMDKPMIHFASLIASLKEEGFIKNSKTFCKKIIHSTLLFNNEKKSIDSIKNALNKNASTRIHKSDSKNHFDIQYFTEKK